MNIRASVSSLLPIRRVSVPSNQTSSSRSQKSVRLFSRSLTTVKMSSTIQETRKSSSRASMTANSWSRLSKTFLHSSGLKESKSSRFALSTSSSISTNLKDSRAFGFCYLFYFFFHQNGSVFYQNGCSK